MKPLTSEFERALDLVDEKICSLFDITLTRIGSIYVPEKNLEETGRMYIPTIAEKWGGIEPWNDTFASLPKGTGIVSFPTYHGRPDHFIDSLIELGNTSG